MKRILEFIEEKKRELDESPFVTFIRDRSIDPRHRFSFAPCIAPFVMAFADLNKYVLRDEASTDPDQQIINTHTLEDDHHAGMYLRDLRTLGLHDAKDFTDLTSTLKFLWGDDRRKTRKAVYGFTGLIANANPRMRLVIVEAIEAAGNAGFTWYNQAAKEFEQLTGQSLHYFGETHLELESGHAMGTVDVEKTLAENIILTDAELIEARRLVSTIFELFIEMGDEFLAYVQKQSKAGSSAWAPPPKAVEVQTP